MTHIIDEIAAMAVSNPLLPLVCAGALTFPGMLMQPPRAFASAASQAVAPTSFVAKAVARSGPAVVTLETQRTVRTAGGNGLPRSLMADPFLRRFFGMQAQTAPRSRVERGQRSGVMFHWQWLQKSGKRKDGGVLIFILNTYSCRA